MTLDKIIGTLLGGAVGDALGMPVEGLSHQNVRTFYRGIKGYTDDEQRRDLHAGQWTDDTQLTFAVATALMNASGLRETQARLANGYVELLPEARRWGGMTRAAVERLARGVSWRDSGEASEPTNGAAMRAAPLGVWWAITGAAQQEAWDFITSLFRITHLHPMAAAAGFGQAFAVSYTLGHTVDTFDVGAFWNELLSVVQWAEEMMEVSGGPLSARLTVLGEHLADFPLDLLDLCNGAGIYADESWPFAVAMFARNPGLLEGTLLSTINAGGDADTTGSMVGSLLGALHGWAAFPAAWQTGLEAGNVLEADARAFAEKMLALREERLGRRE